MYPDKYTKTYLNMSVDLGTDGVAMVSVHEYQNPGPHWVVKYDATTTDANGNAMVNDKGEHGKAWQAMLGKFDTQKKPLFGCTFPPAGFDRSMVQMVYKGGGTPTQISTVLQLVWLHWDLFKVPSIDTTPSGKLQSYVDKWIGLYCTGLVGSYVYDYMVHNYAKRGPGAPISWFADKDNRRSSFDAVQPRDVIVWKDGGHIAIIDRIVQKSNGVLKLGVCESSSDGGYKGVTPADGNTYEVLSVNEKTSVFRVRRGLPCKTPEPDVYIADPCLPASAKSK